MGYDILKYYVECDLLYLVMFDLYKEENEMKNISYFNI